MSRFSKWSLSIRFLHQNPACTSLHTCHMTSPSNSSWLDHHINISWGAQITKLLNMQGPPVYCFLLPLRPKCISQHPILTAHSAYVLPLVWQPKLNTPAKQEQQYSCVYFNSYFSDIKQEDTKFLTEQQQAFPKFNLLLISSRMQSWFVTVVFKYLKFALFSKAMKQTSENRWSYPIEEQNNDVQLHVNCLQNFKHAIFNANF